MTEVKLKSARLIAIEALNKFDPAREYASSVLKGLLGKTNERQRATDLVMGSLRNRTALDTVIEKTASCPVGRIPLKVLNILRVGAYELIYNPETADYSIVHGAVENVKAAVGRKQAGFVNAVLRQIERSIKNRSTAMSAENLRRTLPQSTLTGCEFGRDILADPDKSPADFLSVRFSLPVWLVKNWISEYGVEKAAQICFASNRKPAIYIRANTLKITGQELAEQFASEGIDFDIVDQDTMKLRSPRAVMELPGFSEGLFSVQDITGSMLAKVLAPGADWRILDLCSAPGGKTILAAQMTMGKARITATDIDGLRLQKVRENVERLGLKCVTVVDYEKLDRGEKFDCVVVDVPCSNSGVLSRRVEVRFRINESVINELVKTQKQILGEAADMVTAGGVIVYSTCSIAKEENSGQVRDFLDGHSDFRLETEVLTLPECEPIGCDGGYIAVIRKNG